MKRCVQCGHQGLVAGNAEDTIRVGGRVFSASLPAQSCPECDEVYFSFEELGRFELAVAGQMARDGECGPDVFAFMRKAIGLKAVDLAALLDVVPETLSRWEHGKTPVERRALALLGSMVLEHIDGRSDTVDRLRAMLEHRKLPGTVRLKLLPSLA